MDILKGDVVYVDLEPVRGSETGKMRPCLIIQNNTNNEYSSTTIIIVITSRNILKKKYPTHVWIDKGEGGLTKDSVIQCEQIRTIDKRRITRKLGSVNSNCLQEVEEAIKITLAFGEYTF